MVETRWRDRVSYKPKLKRKSKMSEDRTSIPINDDVPLDMAVPSKSKYLSKEDCATPILAQIYIMTTDEIEVDNGGVEQRAVLHFHGDIKPLIVNNTNKELLKLITGAETVGQLRNKSIVLYNDPTIMFGRKMVGGIRIRAVKANYAPPATMSNPTYAPPETELPRPRPTPEISYPSTDVPFDDDIPY